MTTTARYRLLGVEVNPLSAQALTDLIADGVLAGAQRIIGNHNLHSIYLYHRNKPMRTFYKAAHYVFIDGMPLVWFGKLLGYPFNRQHRTTSLDWGVLLLSQAAQSGWRIFYLGAKPGIAERGAQALRDRFPGLHISAVQGYFDSEGDSSENQSIVEQINAYQPHVILVGMGMPRQEHWIVNNLHRIPASVVIPIGAYMEYMAGALPTPPRWMGRVGMEWIYRLLTQPRHLWKRYLVEPWFLLPLVARDVLNRVTTRFRRGNSTDTAAP